MSLGTDLAAALPFFRTQAELRMSETVTAGLYAESTNPTTLVTTRTLTTSHYTGPARVKYPTLTVSEGVAGGQQVASSDVVVSVPVGDVIPVGAMFIVTASSVDGSLVGREFRVKAKPQSGQVSAHRYPVEELS